MKIATLNINNINKRFAPLSAWLRKALLRKTLEIPVERDLGFRWINPGIYVSRMGFEGFLDRVKGILFFLDENGIDFHSRSVSGGMTLAGKRHFYILSDDLNPTQDESDLIKDRADHVISVGSKVLHGNHVITILHNILDRIEDADHGHPDTPHSS